MSITERIRELRAVLPAGTTLIAVSKTHPVSMIREAYEAGQRIFGENRPLEMRDKHAELPEDISWHLIGHLQTNKIKYIIPFVAMIHSVDSARLLQEIDRHAARIGRTVDVLLEVHIADEQTKSGWQPAELESYLSEGSFRQLTHVCFRGTMGVATNTDDRERIRREFRSLAELHAGLRDRFFDERFDTLSMGMTHDWPVAVECGGNMVRVGSYIFGARDYSK